jgi:hypothetical protein
MSTISNGDMNIVLLGSIKLRFGTIYPDGFTLKRNSTFRQYPLSINKRGNSNNADSNIADTNDSEEEEGGGKKDKTDMEVRRDRKEGWRGRKQQPSNSTKPPLYLHNIPFSPTHTSHPHN